jgi:hypothetical protein
MLADGDRVFRNRLYRGMRNRGVPDLSLREGFPGIFS